MIPRINAPIKAMFMKKPPSMGKVWKIIVVGTKNTSNREAPKIVLPPTANRIDPAINTTIAASAGTRPEEQEVLWMQ